MLASLLLALCWVNIGHAQQPAMGRPAAGRTGEGADAGTAFRIPLELPGSERLFRLESEDSLFERMRQDARENNPPQRLTFPDNPILSRDPYFGRAWPLQKMYVEPNFLCYRRLLFEQPNLERYGWDLGIATPVISWGVFLKDFLLLPYHLGTRPCYDCNAGMCLPGDPVPLMLYPPDLNLTGTLAEGAAIAAILVLFP